MSVINVTNVLIKDNNDKFTDPIEIEISFEALEPLEKGKNTSHTIYNSTSLNSAYTYIADF